MKFKVSISIILLLLMFANVVHGKTLNYWYSDSDRIGFVQNSSIWKVNLSGGFSNTDFNSYYNHARSQWRAAGLITHDGVGDKTTNTINWYAGSEKDLENLEPALRNYSAVTILTFEAAGTHAYKDIKTIYNKRIKKAEIYTPKKPSYYFYTAKKYRTIFTHELGHALGYFGHSTSKNDLMDSNSSTDILTSRDKLHLTQNYDLGGK